MHSFIGTWKSRAKVFCPYCKKKSARLSVLYMLHVSSLVARCPLCHAETESVTPYGNKRGYANILGKWIHPKLILARKLRGEQKVLSRRRAGGPPELDW
jgi:endogenous inhibitor of DNA gyrase (YacG/DUF329 family)